ncbi:SDR family NAD(P)-dependent oxidoreductase [Nonomuraea wenchangensis]
MAVVLVTGASSRLGRDTANALAKDGHKVVAHVRNRSRFAETHPDGRRSSPATSPSRSRSATSPTRPPRPASSTPSPTTPASCSTQKPSASRRWRRTC